MRKLLLALILLPSLVSAQQVVSLKSISTQGSIIIEGGTIELVVPNGVAYGTVGVGVAGTWTGAIAVQCLASTGIGTFVAIQLTPRASAVPVTEISANGQWSGSMAGCQRLRAIATATMSGTATVTLVGAPLGGGGGGGGGSDTALLTDIETNTAQTVVETDRTADAAETLSATVSSSRVNVNVAAINGLTPVTDPCAANTKTTTPVSLTARTVIIAAVSAKKNYICSIAIAAGAAEVFNVVEGTGTTCQTGTAAVVGSTTAANGMSFAANGGFSAVGGTMTVLQGITANVDTCIVPSGSNRLSGFVTWVQQ